MTALLELDGISTGHGDIQALWSVSLAVQPGRATVVMGRNGAGKTTMLSAIAGLLPLWGGAIRWDGREISRVPGHSRVHLGLGFVQEGKRVFRTLTVDENLRLAARAMRSRREAAKAIEQQFERFPILKTRRRARAATLSGGEQQMLAIAQAVIPGPKLLMLDEPTAGLAPAVVKRVFQAIADLRAEGLAILLVEQSVHVALELADEVAVLELGRVAYTAGGDLAKSVEAIEDIYFGARRLRAEG